MSEMLTLSPMDSKESYKPSTLNFEIRITSTNPEIIENFKSKGNKFLLDMADSQVQIEYFRNSSY